MHARELVELASLVSAQGPELIRGQSELSSQSVQQYWVASKCRLDRWTRTLKSLATDAARLEAQDLYMRWPLVRGALEEIILSELLTRVWAAFVSLYDRHRGGNELESLARSILLGHLEVRHRVLKLMLGGRGVDAEDAVRLNHLRRRAERWSDLLVGHFVPLGEVSDSAVDVQRAIEFSRDLDYQSDQKGGRQVWSLLQASLRGGFRQGLSAVSPNEDLNAQIGTAVVSCFPSEDFDSARLSRSLWLHRMTNVANDVQGMIDTLVSGAR